MINDNLLNGLATYLSGGSLTIPSYLAFGSTYINVNAGDIVTSGEFDRNALDSDSVTSNTVKFYGSRGSGEANNEVITNIALVNSSTLRGSSDIQANALIGSLIHTTSFDVGVEFWITFSR